MNEFQRLIRQWKNQLNAWMNGRGGAQPKRPELKMCPVCGRFNGPRATVCEYCESEIAPSGRRGNAPLPGRASSGGPLLEPHAIILIVCVGFYLISAYLSSVAQNSSFFSGLFGINGETLAYLGSNYIVQTLRGEYWRFFTYMFLHGSLIHIFFNMSAFNQLAPYVVEAYGARRFWLVSLVTGAAGGVVSTMSTLFGFGGGNSVGFSGALLGYVGLLFVYFHKTGQVSLAERFKKIMIWLNLICIALSVLGIFRVDNAAHLGGMFMGMGLGYYFHSRQAGKIPPIVEQIVVGVCLLIWFWGLYETFLYVDAGFMGNGNRSIG